MKNISFYSLGGILNKSIQFLLLPLYAHFLTPADYGVLELTYLYGAVIVMLYGFIVENGYSRLFFDKNDEKYRDVLFGTSVIFKLICSFVFLSLSVYFSDYLGSAIFSFHNGSLFIKLISVSVFIRSMAELFMKKLVVEKKAIKYVINNLVFVVVSLLSTVYFVVFLNLKVQGVLYGQIIGGTVQLAFLFATQWKMSNLMFSYHYLIAMLSFSLFLIPTQLASFVAYWSNRLFLQDSGTLDDVGTFSFGYKIASIIPLLFTGPIKKAIGPEIYSLIDNPEICKKRIRQFTLLVFAILTWLSLGMSLFSKEVIMLMADKAYLSSYKVVFVLSMSYVVIGVASIVVLPINIVKKTWYITITWGVSSVINIYLNYLLVPLYGKAGATYATILTFILILVLYFIFSEKLYKVGFQYFRYLFVITIATVAYYSTIVFYFDNLIFNVVYKFIIFILVSIVFFKVVLTKSEQELVINVLRTKILKRRSK